MDGVTISINGGIIALEIYIVAKILQLELRVKRLEEKIEYLMRRVREWH